MFNKIIFIVLLMLLTAGCEKNPITEKNQEIGPIIFASNRDGKNYQIYSMDEDGSNIVQITHSDFPNLAPRWSPDGSKIIFNSRNRTGNFHYESIMLIDRDGSDERMILEHGWYPVFSPDSKTIAFSYDTKLPGFGTPYDIAYYDIEAKSRFIFNENDSFDVDLRDWSPDGRFLLFAGKHYFQDYMNLYLMDLADSTTKKLTDDNSFSGRFSSDGNQIVFSPYEGESHSPPALCVMNRDGSSRETIIPATDSLLIRSPIWSENDTKILFLVWEGFLEGTMKSNIYSINIDGTDRKKLTDEEFEIIDLDYLSK